MTLIIKICGLSERQHVEAALEAGADALGFVFAESVRRVAPETALTISSGLPESIKRVAVMRHPTNDEWQRVLQVFRPDILQTDASDFDTLSIPDDIERWPVFREGGAAPASDATYVYEGRKSGHGETVDWPAASGIATRGRMVLAGGLAANNIAEAISIVRPYGVDVSSAVESARGVKDAGLIREFITAARAAEKRL